MTILAGSGPTEVVREVADWARALASKMSGASGAKYALVADDLDAGNLDVAIYLVRDHLVRWALARSGYELTDQGLVVEARALAAEEDASALKSIQKFAPWLTKLMLLKRMAG